MNKKFLSAILFGALMVTSTGTFVSCKDYDDDIDSLQGQVDTNVSAIDALKSQLSSLQTAGDAAKAEAAAAKAAAEAAKKAGDEALAAAKEAEAVGVLRRGCGRRLRHGHPEGGTVFPAEERPHGGRRRGHQDGGGPGHEPIRQRLIRRRGRLLGPQCAAAGGLYLRRKPGRAL